MAGRRSGCYTVIGAAGELKASAGGRDRVDSDSGEDYKDMPTYVYEILDEQGRATGERFEVVQGMTEEPLVSHPETGQAVRRAFVPFQIGGRNPLTRADKAVKDDRKLEQLGFTKYVKSGDGKYEKVIGKGPSQIQK